MSDTKRFSPLSIEGLQEWMDSDRSFYLVDILTKDHFQKVHLPGAENACVFEVVFLDSIQKIASDRDAEIVLYGSSNRSKDAETAADKLHRAGYRRLHFLDGGLDAWRESGKPLAGDAPDAPDDPHTRLKLNEGTYRVDPEASVIGWTGRNPTTRHYGTVAISQGEMVVNGTELGGHFEIDMNRIQNINLEGDELQPVLISHLKSDDFFFTDVFPHARFTIEGSERAQDPFLTYPNYDISGSLKLCGVSADQQFSATITTTDDGGLIANAHFDLDRTRWGVIYGSTRFFERLGMHIVFDLISIHVKVVAQRTPG